ncbi:hypothetical protein TWF718_001127 [Orbilia javanica]|uniref:Uncharacterized protein n=1 Tax=Orbilia javanica TaxID=47235 RepID=A0AAN8N538_9PEZI
MARVNVNLKGVVYTSLETPTPWTRTHTYDQFTQAAQTEQMAGGATGTLVEQQEGATVTNPNTRLNNRGGIPIETTSTHTFSIITNGFVIATFTAVGTAVSPPRGVPQPSNILPPWEIVVISISMGIFCLILFRAMYHYRRLEMMTKKEQAGNPTPDATFGDSEAVDGKYRISLEVKDVMPENTTTDKTSKKSTTLALTTKYIPKDAKLNNQKGGDQTGKERQNE